MIGQIRRRSGGAGVRYKQVLYIESNGTQILDTGINGGEDVEYEIDYEILPDNVTFAQICASSQNEPFGVKLIISGGALRYQWVETEGATEQSSVLYSGGAYYVNIRHTFKYVGGSVYADDVYKSNIGERGFGSNNFCIFGYHPETYKTKMRLYGCKIWKDGNLVRELVPVEYNNAGYMYDIVSDTLFGDYNGGYFTTGQVHNTIERVEYIQASGIQYINTGFVNTKDTEFEMDFQLTDSTGDRKYIGQSFKFGLGQISNKWRVVDSQWYQTNYSTDTIRHIASTDNGKYYIDSTEIANRYSQKTAGTYPMLLFGVSSQNSAAPDGNTAVMKLYSCKIYDNGVLVRDFYPVVFKGIGYLFDDVSEQLFANAGNGYFGIGPILT